MKYFTQSPTKNENKKPETRKYRREKLNLLTPIYDHREGRVGDDVTLYYPGFQRFIDDTDKVMPSKEDCIFVQKMCLEMTKYCEGEKLRERTFQSLTEKYFDVCMVPSAAVKSTCDLTINPCKCVQVEIKKEIYEISVDSYTQIIGYYVHSLRGRGEMNEVNKKDVEQCPAPGFLLELVGPHLFISGAVYGEYVFVDRLVDPVWLVPQKEEAMIRIARIFKALKRAIAEIRQYYQDPNPVSQPRFPIFQSFYKGNIQYEKAIKRHTFKGTLIYNNGAREDVDVVVMFVKQYSREAHELMDFHGRAPQLIHYEERAGGTQYTAIVMEYISDAMPLDEFLDRLKNEDFNKIKKKAHKRCNEALKVMHDHGFCHGKILSKSILGKVQDRKIQIFIVNYEWAGRQEKATYPLSANIPEGIQPGDPITREQDLAQLEKLFQEL